MTGFKTCGARKISKPKSFQKPASRLSVQMSGLSADLLSLIRDGKVFDNFVRKSGCEWGLGITSNVYPCSKVIFHDDMMPSSKSMSLFYVCAFYPKLST